MNPRATKKAAAPQMKIVGTVALSLEEREGSGARIGVDVYEGVDRVDLILAGLTAGEGLGLRAGEILCLTRWEAKRLGEYLLAASGAGEPRIISKKARTP